MNGIYTSLASSIVKQQQFIVGETLAWSEAKKVSGLKVEDHTISIKTDGKKVLEALVDQYAVLFGRASVEACKDAAKRFLPKMKEMEIPKNLL
jgi:hypothetical protein